MKNKNKVIITCAVTGSVHTPTMSSYLPYSPSDIVESAVEAAEAGASILHLHARDPIDGRPTPDPEVFMEFLPHIGARTDAILNITTGGGLTMNLDARLAAPLLVKPELCSLNLGSMNFGMYPLLAKYKDWLHDWEPAYLEGSRGGIFRNTFADIEQILTRLGEGCQTRFEFECYDTSHLYNLAHFVDRGLAKPPFFIQTVFGLLGGIGTHTDDVMHMRRTALRLFGDDHIWSVLGAGKAQMPLAALSNLLGGNVRVGLEDSLFSGQGRLSKSNAEQVSAIRKIIEASGGEIATPEEARELLKLKGRDKVNL